MYISFLLIILIGCKKSKERSCIKGSGEYDRIKISDITQNKVTLRDNINLVLINDSLDKIEISGGANLLEWINLDKKNNDLVIENNNDCSFLRNKNSILLAYHYTNLDTLNLEGYGMVYNLDTIRNDFHLSSLKSQSEVNLIISNTNTTFILEHGGVSLDLFGNCNNMYVYNLGNGYVDAEKLITLNCHVNSSGIGDIRVNSHTSFVEIRSSADVYIPENSNVVLEDIGEGELKRY